MKNLFSPLFAALLGGAISIHSVQPAPENTLAKSFPAAPGGILVMEVDRGTIKISSHGSEKLEVKVVRKVPGLSQKEAEDLFEHHQITMAPEGNGLKISAGAERRTTSLNKLQVIYTISVPTKYNVDLKTAGGHIEITSLQGETKARTSGGHIKLGSLTGPIQANTSGGHIHLERGDGTARLQTSGGHIRVGDLEGNLTAQTSGGHIEVKTVSGSVQAETSGGHIKIAAAGGVIDARTSGGHITAALTSSPKADCNLKTSGGHVDLTLPSTIDLALDAETRGGHVRSDFPGQLNKQKTKLFAQVNDGGPEVLLRTTGGNIHIRKQ